MSLFLTTSILLKLRYKINVVASDLTGGIEFILEDREARTLTGKRAPQLVDDVLT